MAINHKTYGVPKNCNLQHDSLTAPFIKLIIYGREKCLKGELILKGVCLRYMDKKHNPHGIKNFIFEIMISAANIQEWGTATSGNFLLGDEFNPPDSSSFKTRSPTCPTSRGGKTSYVCAKVGVAFLNVVPAKVNNISRRVNIQFICTAPW
jgi:hypothetical protein